ncbi:MAG: DegT/DnrJ/EryC1/StrS family aminotransferase [Victivallales bacterium]|nr:DegT/DnrJ/EryC1/StrS family aminotransferase [Victivallales bacterium]
MKVPLLDVKAQYEENNLREEIIPLIDEICSAQAFVFGKRLENFEQAIADYSQCKYAVGVSSGSDALLISLMVEGIGYGDEVITTPFTFFATVGAIWRTGAKPVFADINPDDFNINPELIEDKITPRTKAIMPVHLFGQTARMDRIMEIAEKHNLAVIEDAAQAIGAEYQNKRAGSFGDYGCFSFYPSKNLGAFGDAGIVTTNDKEIYEKLKMFRNHGADPVTRYMHEYVGGNFRMDSLQAAVLHVKLQYLDKWSRARQENADLYRKLLTTNKIKLPVNIDKATRHIYNQFSIRVADGKRDELQKKLSESGIGSAIYYPLSLHLQKCFSSLGYKEGDFPVSEQCSRDILALPVYPELKKEQLEYIAETINNAFKG